MIKPLRIVFSGVENSGKSTLSKVMSEILGWELIPEMCREDEEVLRLEEVPDTLTKLHYLQEDMALNASERATEGIICDTGALELEMWSKMKFNESLNLETSLPVNLYVLCETLPIWEVGHIRQMPEFKDRKLYEALFYEAHCAKVTPFVVLPPVSLEERINLVLHELKSLRGD